jgi:hypothetical protein
MNEPIEVGGNADPDYKVWTCKLIVPKDTYLPPGFDAPPRRALYDVMERHGVDVVGIFSGWAGSLDEVERQVIQGEPAQ